MENNELEKKVMEEIKGGRIKLKSRYVFLAEKLGLGSAFVLSVILAVLFFSLFLFYLQVSDNLIYLSFGSRGLLAFLESFPYLLIFGFSLFIILSLALFKRSEASYKKPFIYFIFALFLFIIFAGGVLATTGMITKLNDRELGEKMLRPLMGPGCACGNYGIAGRIIEIKNDWLALQTPEEIKKLDLRLIDPAVKSNLFDGMFVVASGKDINGYFTVRMIKIVEEGEILMIRKNIGRRFGQDFHRPMLGGGLNTTTRDCFSICLKNDKMFFECERQCLTD